MTDTVLFIIDPQKDFIESPDYKGSLAVPGAYEDCQRLAQYIDKTSPDAIIVTLDTHERYDISLPLWWVNSKGQHPAPFTIITPEDVKTEKWTPYDPEEKNYALFYVNELARKGNYPLCIWPNHVIKGSIGHQVDDFLQKSLNSWEEKNGKQVQYVIKGMNPRTEHYSALKAEVELADEDTHLNGELINTLKQFKTIKVAGEAKSHCTAGSTLDLLDNLGKDYLGQVEILEDCMSSVPGFERQGEEFIEKARLKGAIITSTQQLLSKKIKP